MILWLALFFLVIAISFVLALLSMRDFQELPRSQEYGLFLIRNPAQFRADILDLIHTRIAQEGLIVSLERLFKGKKSTLVIFGPKKVLESLPQLDLLELEDYTDVNRGNLSAWEVGVESFKDTYSGVKSFFKDLPQLDMEEQFWWQIVLGSSFQSQIRAVIVSPNLQRRQDISQKIQRIDLGRLTKIPKPFTENQFLDFYQRRSLILDPHNPNLTPQEVLQLILLS